MAEKSVLSPQIRKIIWEAIRKDHQAGERPPEEIIYYDFKGDTNAYLIAMAKNYGIKID